MGQGGGDTGEKRRADGGQAAESASIHKRVSRGQLDIKDNDLPLGPLLRFIPISLVWSRNVTPDSALRAIGLADRSRVVALHFHLYLNVERQSTRVDSCRLRV